MLKGKLSIGRPTPGDYINIEVIDDLSGAEFLELHISYADFARAITGSSYIDCEFTLHSKVVGMRREMKEEIVPVGENVYRLTEEEKTALLAPFEVDGWKCWHRPDLGNHHKQAGKGYRVSFARYVPVE